MPTSRVALGSPHVLLHAYRPLAERPGSYLAQVAGFFFLLPFIHHCQGSFLQDRPTGIPMRRDDGATSSTIDAVTTDILRPGPRIKNQTLVFVFP